MCWKHSEAKLKCQTLGQVKVYSGARQGQMALTLKNLSSPKRFCKAFLKDRYGGHGRGCGLGCDGDTGYVQFSDGLMMTARKCLGLCAQGHQVVPPFVGGGVTSAKQLRKLASNTDRG